MRPSSKAFAAIASVALSALTFADDALPRFRETKPAWMGERDDPGADGWASEVFSAAAARQLGRLARWMEAEPGEGIDLAVLAHESFTAGAVRASRLRVVYEQGSLRVRRPAPEGIEADDDTVTGVKGLENALAAVLEPLRNTAQRRVKFEVFGVTARSPSGNGPVSTRVRWQVVGRTASGSLQLNAIWSCDWEFSSSGVALLRSIEVEEYEEIVFTGPGATLFSDCTESVLGADPAFNKQLRFGNEYWMRRMQSVLGIDNYGHHGLAVGDVNGDGLEDVYVCQTGGMPNRLFVQNADGTARDVSADAGVDFMERTHAALLIDLDNDGDQDLVLATQASLLFLANDGTGRFEKVGESMISAYSLAAADYDADGDLDVYATAYVAPSEWDRQGGLGLQPLPYHDANNGAANVLVRNDGEWTFTDVTSETGLDVNNRRWSFAAAWADYDGDGDQDLYVANDFGRNNLYRNDGGRFVDVAAEAGVEDSASGMSVSWGDYDGDGRLDLYVGNMFSSAGNRIVPQDGFQPGAGESVKSDFRRFARGNTLFRNNGDGTFRDVSEAAGVTMGRWAWSSPFVDLNNDGWEDLVVGNGYITNENSGDL